MEMVARVFIRLEGEEWERWGRGCVRGGEGRYVKRGVL